MKKLLFTLLTAACFAGAASAISWSAVDASSDGTYTLSDSYTSSTSFTVAYAFNIADDTALAAFSIEDMMMSLTGTNGTQTIYAAIGASSSQQRVYVNSDSTFWTRSSEGLTVGGNTIAFVVNRDTKNTTTINYYVNGTLIVGSGLGVKWTDNETYYSLAIDTVTIVDDDIAGGKLFVADGALSASDIATLPEPTALAFLALGAAGLALRRKAA